MFFTLARIIGAYALITIVSFIIYILSFGLPIGSSILFYRGLLLAILTALLTLISMVVFRRALMLDLPTIVGATFTSLAFNVCFLVLFPVTFDRSISVFLLSRIGAQQGVTTDQLKQQFASEYLNRMNQIERRVSEQTTSGNIAVGPDGRIVLTPQGRRFVALAQTSSRWFMTDPRFVNPQVATPTAAGKVPR
jgi:hypothetical protein